MRHIYWDGCCKRWRKDTDGGSWDMDEHEYKECEMEEIEMYGNTVAPSTDLADKYIVWSPESTEPPRVVFGMESDAIKAAYAMAGKYPGNRFTVAKIEGVAAVETVKYTEFKKKVTK